MTSMILGTVEGTPSGGTVPVRIPGAPAVVNAQATWQTSSATSGCQVLVATEGGRLWAVALVGASGSKPSTSHASDTAGTPLAPEQVGGWGGQSTLPPSWTGTWRGSAWRDDTQQLMQGDPGGGANQGAAFWPVASWGQIGQAGLRVHRMPGGDPAQHLIVMGLLAGPMTETWPTVLDTQPGPVLEVGAEQQWTLPSEWLAPLSTGAAGGIGVVGGQVAIIDGSQMDLTIQWTRTV